MPGGRGVFLMRRLVDHLEYNAAATRVRMTSGRREEVAGTDATAFASASWTHVALARRCGRGSHDATARQPVLAPRSRMASGGTSAATSRPREQETDAHLALARVTVAPAPSRDSPLRTITACLRLDATAKVAQRETMGKAARQWLRAAQG